MSINMVAGQGPVRLQHRLSPRSREYLERIERRGRKLRILMPIAAGIFAFSAAVGAFTPSRNSERKEHRQEPRRTLVDELPETARQELRLNLAKILCTLKQQQAKIREHQNISATTDNADEQKEEQESDESPFLSYETDERFCYVFVRNLDYNGAHVDILVMGRMPKIAILDSKLTLRIDIESNLFFPDEVIPFRTFQGLEAILLERCMRLQDRPDELLRE